RRQGGSGRGRQVPLLRSGQPAAERCRGAGEGGGGVTAVLKRESPMGEAVAHLHPQWADVHGMKFAARIGEESRERQLVESLALCDASCLPKLGVKGPGAQAWLQSQGIAVPKEIY